MTGAELPGRGRIDMFQLDPENPFEGQASVYVVGGLDAISRLEEGPLVRMHSRCLYGEVFSSDECDCRAQLDTARNRMLNEGNGILFYLDQEGRGAGLETKARGYELSYNEGLDTTQAYKKLGVPFDQRQYGHCVRFLLDNGIAKVRLMSNNPRKISALTDAGILVERVPLVVGVNAQNIGYLRTKRDKAGHLLPDNL